MSSSDITRYVVTVTFHEESLTEINEVNNHLTRAGFLLTMSDNDGNIRDLGTNSYGLISTLEAEEVKALAGGLTKSALGREVDIIVTTWENWQNEQQ